MSDEDLMKYEYDCLADRNLELARSFGIIYRRSMAYMARECSKFELSFSEFVILVHLYERNCMRQERLAGLLDIDKAAVTRTINLLEAKGLVERLMDNNDRRVRIVSLTEAGAALKPEITGIISCWSDFLWDGIAPELAEPFRQAVGQMAEKASGGLAISMPSYRGGVKNE